MSKAEKTKQYIIEKSAPIFNVKGYGGTTLSEIQDAVKLSRGAIYGNFADKNEIAIEAFEYNSSQSYKRFEDVINKRSSAKESLLAYAGLYSTNWKSVLERGGCPMQNAAVEADDHLHFLRENVRNSINKFIKKLQQIIEDGQLRGEFKPDKNALEYAELIFSLMEGNIMLAKIMNDPKYLHNTSKKIKSIVENDLLI